jgi:hypothetical protein
LLFAEVLLPGGGGADDAGGQLWHHLGLDLTNMSSKAKSVSRDSPFKYRLFVCCLQKFSYLVEGVLMMLVVIFGVI